MPSSCVPLIGLWAMNAECSAISARTQDTRHRQSGPVGSWLDKEYRMSFHGFSPKTAKFLRDLAKNNNREWFEGHRPEYEEHVMGPARDFVLAMAERLDKFDPAIEATPKVNGSIRRNPARLHPH